MNRASSEEFHNTLLAFQDLPFFEEIQKKASRDLAFLEEIHKKVSHDQKRECYDDFEGYQIWTEVSKDFQSGL